MKKTNNKPDWQKHLDELDDQFSANNFFVSNYKNANALNSYEASDDIFRNPLISEDSLADEGQLSIDVYQDKNNIIVKALIAGVKPDEIKVDVHDDLLTIKGERKRDSEISNDNYFYKECFWGKFSRSIVLPAEVSADQVKATFKDGILTIVLPKIKSKKSANIKVQEE